VLFEFGSTYKRLGQPHLWCKFLQRPA
jgi:hypothetical protein